MQKPERARSGVAPLCWEQHWPWVIDHPVIRRGAPSRLLVVDVPVPPGVTVRHFASCLDRLSARHEALRTVFRQEENGTPVQEVLPRLAPGRTLVDVTGLGDRAAGAAVAAQVPTGIDIAAESSLHSVLGVSGDAVVRAVLVAHWLAVDGVSMSVVWQELVGLLGAGANASPVPEEPGWHPLDQARAQATERMRRTNRRALEHWAQSFLNGPRSTLPVYWNRTADESPCLSTTLRSDELMADNAAVADAYGTTPAIVWAAVICTLLTTWTGHSSCALGNVFSNRTGRRLARSVGRYSAGTRVVVDLSGSRTFADVVARTHKAFLTSYARSVHDAGAYVMEESRASARLGARVTSSVEFEYFDHLAAGPDGAVGERSTKPRLTQRRLADTAPGLLINVYPDPENPRVEAKCPAALLPDAAARDLLTQLAALTRAARDGDASLAELTALVDLPAYWHGPHWVSIQDSWVDREDVRRMLLSHPAVGSAAVFPRRDDENGPVTGLAAYVVAAGAEPAAAELVDHVREAVSECPTAVAPRSVTLCRRAPDDPDDPAAWEALAVPWAADTGTPDDTPRTPGERLLAAAITACHPGLPVPMSKSYAEAGGEFPLVPYVLERLAAEGCRGLDHFGPFMGITSLRRLAARLIVP